MRHIVSCERPRHYNSSFSWVERKTILLKFCYEVADYLLCYQWNILGGSDRLKRQRVTPYWLSSSPKPSPSLSCCHTPATLQTVTEESHHAAPYSLSGASRPQLARMTVTALKSHLKHYKLPITGKKSVLVDCLHSHLHSSQASISVDMLDSDTSNS